MIWLLASAGVLLAMSLAIGPIAHKSAKYLRPAEFVPAAAAAALAIALGFGTAMTALSIGYLVGWSPLAQLSGISVARWDQLIDVPAWVGFGAGIAVIVLLAAGAARATAIVVALVRCNSRCRMLPGSGPFAFIDDSDIYTMAGVRGRVVVGLQLFNKLTADDQRVVIAHELSHLRHRHHLYVHAIDIAAAANPFLRSARSVVHTGIERWADEDAAAEVHDRELTARALARVALQRQQLRIAVARSLPTHALAFTESQIAQRVSALLGAEPRTGRIRILLTAVAALAFMALGIASLSYVHGLIELAQG